MPWVNAKFASHKSINLPKCTFFPSWKLQNISHFPGYWLLSQISHKSWTVTLQLDLPVLRRFIQVQSSRNAPACSHHDSSLNVGLTLVSWSWPFTLSGLRSTLLEGETHCALNIMPHSATLSVGSGSSLIFSWLQVIFSNRLSGVSVICVSPGSFYTLVFLTSGLTGLYLLAFVFGPLPPPIVICALRISGLILFPKWFLYVPHSSCSTFVLTEVISLFLLHRYVCSSAWMLWSTRERKNRHGPLRGKDIISTIKQINTKVQWWRAVKKSYIEL